MKKIIILLLTAIMSVAAYAQTDVPDKNGLLKKIRSLNSRRKQLNQQKDYSGSLDCLLQMQKLMDSVFVAGDNNEESLKGKRAVQATLFYDIACTYSLLNKRKLAIDAFEASIQAGFNDYRHVLNDTDLDNLRKEKRFTKLVSSLRKYDKLVILQEAKGYRKENTDTMPTFTYRTDDINLRNLHEYFKLDSVAGTGDEVSKIKNILAFVHNAIRHDGSNYALCEVDAIDIYNYHKATGRGVNCRLLAIALNEMYLSMGFASRYVTCLPKDSTDGDCHVINTVYSRQINKWIWVDPTFNAYVMDENGNLLSIAEVRERLRTGQPLVLNETANWNNQEKETKEHYLDYYMAKNLYWMQCVVDSRFNPESRYRPLESRYVTLVPEGAEQELSRRIFTPKYIVHDPEYFWQLPVSYK
ncbi:transglutaminase-like domain-containing protein [Prevotella dentasini]|uniref:transglutaminase-like domain-containing protein n=1 Tax=Prevotella dentasini TaxID=589537 RepID=UPI00046A5A46|nr:transglutaminase-like domain-containing protein [Prevotella dentasini]